jgi:hypothetical protein
MGSWRRVKVGIVESSTTQIVVPGSQWNNNDKQIVVVVVFIVGSISRSGANVNEEGEEINTPTNIFTLNTFFLRCIILCLLCILEFTYFNVSITEYDKGKSYNYA